MHIAYSKKLNLHQRINIRSWHSGEILTQLEERPDCYTPARFRLLIPDTHEQTEFTISKPRMARQFLQPSEETEYASLLIHAVRVMDSRLSKQSTYIQLAPLPSKWPNKMIVR